MRNRLSLSSTVPAVAAGTLFYNPRDQLSADAYDGSGNTIGSGGVSYTYDFENHLIGKGGNIQVFYDGDGVRVAKKVGTQTTWYVTAEQNLTGYAQVIHEETSPPPGSSFFATRQYVYGLDLIAQRRAIQSQPFEVRYYGYDGHGSVRLLTDGNGTVTDTYDYDAFGNLVYSTFTGATPTPNRYLYAGEQFDADLGLYYLRARYLDVRNGRFWTMDKFEGASQEPLSLHKYRFASSDPVNRKDPSGRLDLVEIQIATTIGLGLESANLTVGGSFFSGLLLCLENPDENCAQNVAADLLARFVENVRRRTSP